MSEYIFSNEITTLAVNMEDGSWRVIHNDSHLGCKYFWMEWETGPLQTSGQGKVYLLERPGETADGTLPIVYEVETPGQALDAGQVGIVTRVYIDVNTRGDVLAPWLVIDGGDVVALPYTVQTTRRAVVEIPVDGVPARIVGVRLQGALTRRVDLYEVAVDVSVGEQEHQGAA